ncbi:hypothetical protein [Leifsonia sp. PS1209]|uniref:hypothetical protein n=1 Tax=Leifsonia sp. PS1209 TaxID=2724914 RepID=UPI001442E59F|nr:hypothetical protein [Leifsonia sp. PS1209]QIZ99577.1 hypothetical protein HF024_14385 [Leifsonia sp. PS1209]
MRLTKADIRYNWLSSSILGIAVPVQLAGLVFIAIGIATPSSIALMETGATLTFVAVATALVGFSAGLALNLARRRKRR